MIKILLFALAGFSAVWGLSGIMVLPEWVSVICKYGIIVCTFLTAQAKLTTSDPELSKK